MWVRIRTGWSVRRYACCNVIKCLCSWVHSSGRLTRCGCFCRDAAGFGRLKCQQLSEASPRVARLEVAPGLHLTSEPGPTPTPVHRTQEGFYLTVILPGCGKPGPPRPAPGCRRTTRSTLTWQRLGT